MAKRRLPSGLIDRRNEYRRLVLEREMDPFALERFVLGDGWYYDMQIRMENLGHSLGEIPEEPLPADVYEAAGLVDEYVRSLERMAAEIEWRKGAPERACRRAKLRARATLADLTPRRREVASLWSKGLTQREVAIRLGISAGSISRHVGDVAGRTGREGEELRGWLTKQFAQAERNGTA